MAAKASLFRESWASRCEQNGAAKSSLLGLHYIGFLSSSSAFNVSGFYSDWLTSAFGEWFTGEVAASPVVGVTLPALWSPVAFRFPLRFERVPVRA